MFFNYSSLNSLFYLNKNKISYNQYIFESSFIKYQYIKKLFKNENDMKYCFRKIKFTNDDEFEEIENYIDENENEKEMNIMSKK